MIYSRATLPLITFVVKDDVKESTENLFVTALEKKDMKSNYSIMSMICLQRKALINYKHPPPTHSLYLPMYCGKLHL